MVTIEKLKEYGANTKDGIERCLNNTDFYLKMVNMGIKDSHFEALETAIKQNDLDQAFEAAHALKGIFANIALTPMYEAVNEINETLRGRAKIDYSAMMEKISQERQKLLAMQTE